MNARSRYDYLTSDRQHFLDIAVQCSELTLPYLIQRDDSRMSYKSLKTPWQSVGSKCVVTFSEAANSAADCGADGAKALASAHTMRMSQCALASANPAE